jgi:hypothetical protein
MGADLGLWLQNLRVDLGLALRILFRLGMLIGALAPNKGVDLGLWL